MVSVKFCLGKKFVITAGYVVTNLCSKSCIKMLGFDAYCLSRYLSGEAVTFRETLLSSPLFITEAFTVLRLEGPRSSGAGGAAVAAKP